MKQIQQRRSMIPELLRQTRMTMRSFSCLTISKYDWKQCIADEFHGVWIYLVFDTSAQSKPKLKKKRRDKILKKLSVKITYPQTVTIEISLV